jgi:hypothetical protein
MAALAHIVLSCQIELIKHIEILNVTPLDNG